MISMDFTFHKMIFLPASANFHSCADGSPVETERASDAAPLIDESSFLPAPPHVFSTQVLPCSAARISSVDRLARGGFAVWRCGHSRAFRLLRDRCKNDHAACGSDSFDHLERPGIHRQRRSRPTNAIGFVLRQLAGVSARNLQSNGSGKSPRWRRPTFDESSPRNQLRRKHPAHAHADGLLARAG